MKKLLTTFGLTIAAALANPAMAGPGDGYHFHGSKPAAEAVVIKCADQRKESLVKGGKLEGSSMPRFSSTQIESGSTRNASKFSHVN
jgi:hypothetical protein